MKPADDPSLLWPLALPPVKSESSSMSISDASTVLAPASPPTTIAEPIIRAIRISELRDK